MSPRTMFLCVLFSVTFTGCASVTVTKVGDEDGLKGLRYYLPRPYVMVHEPFVVGSDAYVVEGEMSQDGQYVLITETTDDLNGVLKATTAGNRIPAGKVLANTPGEDRGEAQAGEEGDVTPEPTDTAIPVGEGEETPTPGGMLNVKMTNDNNAYAVTPLKRYMDIIWLPDFDEQYVVSGRSGLGNASIDMSMGQGWNLQGLDSNADNSALAEPLVGFYKDSVAALSKVVQTKLGVLPVEMGEGEAQAGEEELRTATFDGGTPLSIKITVVRMAAPGLYPILKPDEMCGNKICKVSAFPNYAQVKDRVLIPVPPLTNVAFNTYDVVVIEAATVSGDSPLRLHQYPTNNTPDNPVGSAANVTSLDPEAVIKDLHTSIGRLFDEGTESRWEVKLQLKGGGGKALTANLSKIGMPEKPEDRAKTIIKQTVAQREYTISDGDINVQASP